MLFNVCLPTITFLFRALKIVLTKINLDVLSADPLLGFAFFFICHENEYSLLIEHIPVLIVLSGIQWKLSSLENHSQDLVCVAMNVFYNRL